MSTNTRLNGIEKRIKQKQGVSIANSIIILSKEGYKVGDKYLTEEEFRELEKTDVCLGRNIIDVSGGFVPSEV